MKFNDREKLIEFLLKFNPVTEKRIKIGHGSILTFKDAELFVTRHTTKNHLMIVGVNNRGHEKTTLPESEYCSPNETYFDEIVEV